MTRTDEARKSPAKPLDSSLQPQLVLELQKLNWLSANVISIVAMILVAGSIVWDLIEVPEHIVLFLVGRTTITVALALLLFSMHLFKARKYGEYFSMGVFLVCGIGLAVLMQFLGVEHPYYAAILLVYIGTLTIPWGPKNNLITCLIIVSAFAIPSIIKPGFQFTILFINNVAFQLEVIALVVTITWLQNKNRKREILNRLIIARQSAELEERDRYKSEFLSNITHELKTPLAIVIGTNDILTEKVADRIPGLAGLSRIVQQGAYQLAAHIDRIISVSRLDNPAEKLEFQPCNYCGIVHSLQGLFAAKAEYEQIAYTVDCPEKLIVNGDSIRLQEVLVNLVQNALKFTPKGGAISVNVFERNNQVVTQVIDTGIGIPADKIGRIFDRLFQADGTLSKRHGGIGLGLHIVKNNVELHRGTVVVQSIEGAGSTFCVSLPLHTDQNARLPADSDVNPFEYHQTLQSDDLASMVAVSDFASCENQNPSRPSVLIVEDNRGMMQVMIEALREGYNIMLAAGAREALDKLARGGNSISLILSDIMMPAMSGFDFCKEVMAHAEHKKIPLIFVTALMSEEEQLKGFCLGATDYITKPFSIKILKEKVDHWVARRRYEQLLENISGELDIKVRQLARTKEILLHEVRNPVQVITTAESLIAFSPEGRSPEFTEFCTVLRSGILGLRNVLESVQQLDALGAGSRVSVAPRDLIEETMKQTGHLLGSVTVTREVACAEDIRVLVNRQMIVLVLVNLIRNGVEAIQARGGSAGGAIGISTNAGESRVELTISDNGIGIAPESQARLFEFKYTTKQDGAGIGLHLSRMMVKLNDGAIDMESVPGEGSRFTISLPTASDRVVLT